MVHSIQAAASVEGAVLQIGRQAFPLNVPSSSDPFESTASRRSPARQESSTMVAGPGRFQPGAGRLPGLPAIHRLLDPPTAVNALGWAEEDGCGSPDATRRRGGSMDTGCARWRRRLASGTGRRPWAPAPGRPNWDGLRWNGRRSELHRRAGGAVASQRCRGPAPSARRCPRSAARSRPRWPGRPAGRSVRSRHRPGAWE